MTSCSGIKHLNKDEILVKTTTVSFDNPTMIDHKAQLHTELLLVAKPTPDYGLGYFNLWVYNTLRNLEKKKGLRHWIKKTFGRPPQLYDPVLVNRSKLILEKDLMDNGYLGSVVRIDTVVKDQQMTLDYRVYSNGHFAIKNVYFPSDTTPVGKLINEFKRGTAIDTTKYYTKAALDEERLRLTRIAGNKGYIDFQENFLFYLLDTTKARLQTDIYIEIHNPTDSALYQPYQIGETYVYPAYLLDDTLAHPILDTIYRKNLTTIQPQEIVKPKVLDRSILQNKGGLVNRDLQDISVNHLLNLGVFKFVRLKYEKRDSGTTRLLDRYFYLTPGLTQNVQYEFQLNNRSGGFLGSAASVQYSHNNFFHGAEQFNVKLSAGIETQFQNQQSFINTSDLTLEASLLVPKLILPFKFNKYSLRHVPRTRFSISNTFQRRTNLYTINSTNLDMAYEWQQNRKIKHEYSLLRVNRLSVWNESDEFRDLLARDTRLNNSFDDIFIIGSNYTFIYNSSPKNEATPYYYFRTEIGTSGNLISLFSKANPANETGTFLGKRYAQFIKFTPDFRYYIPRRKSMLASRLLFGIGIPYKNSQELPYIEQFFVGGSNSIRAFQLRGLGPGSYIDESMTADNTQFIDQTGDIKLEFNLEYRFDIIQYLKGAFFLDGGNIWLLNSTDRPAGVFKFNRFHKEIAFGTGFGLRLDFDFFVVRLDTAFPLRKPIANGQFGWTFNDLALYKQSWRKENLVYNLAIGFPF